MIKKYSFPVEAHVTQRMTRSIIFAQYQIVIIFSNIFGQEDFSEGPYGINYFDTAGPFTVQDLNSPVMGDINADDILNIQIEYNFNFYYYEI